ncbi:MAG: hypothetical protein R3E90_08980 [Marinicella sp.]|nr:hypothetical protein [Xanthomonadales bacterium]
MKMYTANHNQLFIFLIFYSLLANSEPVSLFNESIEMSETDSNYDFGKRLIIEQDLISQVEDDYWNGKTNFKGAEKSQTPPAGLTGNWYNPNQSGHGFMIEVLPDNRVLLSWYTYNLRGDPVWLLGVGNWNSNDNSISINMNFSYGMAFGYFIPSDLNTEYWGNVTVRFNDCNSASVSYSSSYVDFYTGQMYGNGSFPFSRLTSIKDLNCSLSGGGQANNTTYLRLQNKLLNDVNLTIDGQYIGTSEAGLTQGSTVSYTGSRLVVNWTLEKTGNSVGFEVGDNISGSFTIDNPGSTTDLVINNRFSNGDAIFVPFFNNTSGSDILIGVNMGLQSENRCNCTVPAGGNNVKLGYYLFYRNTNVRAYQSGSNYTGQYTYWENLVPYLQTDTGRINFEY